MEMACGGTCPVAQSGNTVCLKHEGALHAHNRATAQLGNCTLLSATEPLYDDCVYFVQAPDKGDYQLTVGPNTRLSWVTADCAPKIAPANHSKLCVSP